MKDFYKYLFLLILKTPLKHFFIFFISKNIFKDNKSLISRKIEDFFFRRYLFNFTHPYYAKKIVNKITKGKNNLKWVKYYYHKHWKNLKNLEDIKKTVGKLKYEDTRPIFKKVINFIKERNFKNNNDVYLILIGSASGRDLEFFTKQFPNINFISTDVDEEIINFQKKKYNFNNWKFYKCGAEDLHLVIKNSKLTDKELIIIDCGSLQYCHPFFIDQFFIHISKFKKVNLFINSPISLEFLKTGKKSSYRSTLSFSHNYPYFCNKYFHTLEEKIIRPYPINDPIHSDTGIIYIHCCYKKLNKINQ